MYVDNHKDFDFSIDASESASSEVHLEGMQPTALELPAAFEATTTLLLFKVGRTAGDLDWLRDSSENTVTVTVAEANTNKRPYLDANKFTGGWTYWQIVAVSADTTADEQTSARAITLVAGKVI